MIATATEEMNHDMDDKETKCRASMEQLLDQHVPNLPAEVRDYLSSYLADYVVGHVPADRGSGEEDQDEDPSLLYDTITQLLDGQQGGNDFVLSSLVAAVQGHQEQGMVSKCFHHQGSGSSNHNGSQAYETTPLLSLAAASKPQQPADVTDDERQGALVETQEGNDPTKSVMKHSNRKDLRRDRRQNQKRNFQLTGKLSRHDASDGRDDNDDDPLDKDHASAWNECQSKGVLWGGRGRGGRGIRSTENKQSIHLHNVTLQFAGNELLTDSPMDIVKGHRYGLIGRNGVGKSTLFQQLARLAIPGLPHDLRILLVYQHPITNGNESQSALELLLQADIDRVKLLQDKEKLERRMEDAEDEIASDFEETAQRLSDVLAELDAIDAECAPDRARKILKGLSFTNDMIHGPIANLSGGWRMRLALAQALFVPSSDLILLDECTNHLDLHGLDWLIRYIRESDHTLMVVSHDRSFLDAICTDIVVMEHQRLTYHVGSYTHYQQQVQEKASREAQILDAADRQRSKAVAFVQKQQSMANKKNADPNKQRQAKMIKEKKMDRIGNYRDGRSRVETQISQPYMASGVAEGGLVVRLEDVSFGYNRDQPNLLQHLTLNLTRGCKVALVGRNGCGKSTLLGLVTGESGDDGTSVISGELWRHPSLRIGHVTQYSVEELEEHAHQTVVNFAEANISNGKASSSVIAAASGNIRQYLGGFGLGGKHAHREIGKLSGGERMRLCFAKVLAHEPHLLILDESTNHVDLETLDSMAHALNEYQGAVLMVSHNQSFLSVFCKELWVLDDQGQLTAMHADTESFDEMFSQYRNDVLSPDGAAERSNQRRTKVEMAKRATKQKAGSRVNTALL